jgi:type IV pilus assembly protein PilQ
MVENPEKNEITLIFKDTRPPLPSKVFYNAPAPESSSQSNGRKPLVLATRMLEDDSIDNDFTTFSLVVSLNQWVKPSFITFTKGLTVTFAEPAEQASRMHSPGENRNPASTSMTDSGHELEDDDPVSKPIQEFLTAKASKKFHGKTITLESKDADVRDVLKLIGDTSGFNIVIADSVKGKLNLSLQNVPWDQALEVVLSTNGLGAERVHNILTVMPLGQLKREKEEQLRAKFASQAAQPRATRIFAINHATLKDLQSSVQSFIQALATGGTGTNAGSATFNGFVQIDDRTNSLIVYDTLDNLDKIKKLIDVLDIPTAQIMIEAKIIEASDQFADTLGGAIAFAGDANIGKLGLPFATAVNGLNPLASLFSSPTYDFADSSASVGGSPGMTFGASPILGFLKGTPFINTLLSWGESQALINIAAAPKTVVINRSKAKITHGTPVVIPGLTTVAGVGSVPTSSVEQAFISLEVTPSITNDGAIMLDLKISKDLPALAAGGGSSTYGIATRSLDTKVLVDDDTTLVIGGLYQLQDSKNITGVPYLRKIPIIGWLFGSEGTNVTKNELFIFITPKMVATKEPTSS